METWILLFPKSAMTWLLVISFNVGFLILGFIPNPKHHNKIVQNEMSLLVYARFMLIPLPRQIYG
jgi:hypothetical protein